MKPVIITTSPNTRAIDGLSKGLQQKELFQNYADAIVSAGGLPLLALGVDRSTARQLAEQANGLYLPGGVDVNPRLYGEEKLPVCGVIDDSRDQIEMSLILAFLEAKKPILGVCRGMQMINIALGGSVYQDIQTQLTITHTYNSVHPVIAVPSMLLEELFGKEFMVNSLHHQAVSRLGAGLVPIAHSRSGAVVEAVMHTHLPILATQWHPERMIGVPRWSPDGPDMQPLFNHFVSLCSNTLQN